MDNVVKSMVGGRREECSKSCGGKIVIVTRMITGGPGRTMYKRVAKTGNMGKRFICPRGDPVKSCRWVWPLYYTEILYFMHFQGLI